MHAEAREWVARFATAAPLDILDLGGRDVNGTVRDLFPGAATYTVLDIQPGPNVDIVADAADWDQDGCRWDLALLLETCEHTPSWPEILRTAYRALAPGGRLVVTTAAPGRPVHSGVDGGSTLHPGEHYANVEPADLERELKAAGFADIVIDVQPSPSDVRAVAAKPG